MLYKGIEAVEAGEVKNHPAGPYKFKVKKAEYNEQYKSVNFELETWGDDGSKGPKVLDSFKIESDKDVVLAETDRRLTVMMGRPELNSASDLVGKAGYVVMRKVEKYLEPMPFGGYYTADRKSATGDGESMAKRIKEAIDFNWEDDAYCVSKVARRNAKSRPSTPSSPETDENMPF